MTIPKGFPMNDDFDPSLKPIDGLPSFPPLVKIAGVAWIVFGILILLESVVLFLVSFVLSGRGPRQGDAEPNVFVAVFVALFGAAFLHVGVQSVRGTARDTLGNGIGSIVFGLFSGLSALGTLAAGQFVQFGINLLAGGGLLAAGILALIGRSDYKVWRKASKSYPEAR